MKCLIFGGETTVTLQGEGLGGRCQEMALAAALCLGQSYCAWGGSVVYIEFFVLFLWRIWCWNSLIEIHLVEPSGHAGRSFNIKFLATSTDGQDGPTDASGALATQATARQAFQQGLDMGAFLERSDSYSFFSSLNGGANQLRSGLTGTNLMDVVFIFIEVWWIWLYLVTFR